MDRIENSGRAGTRAPDRRGSGRTARHAAGLLLVPLCALAGDAAAQTAPAVTDNSQRAGIEEIVVTASRREERLSKVPVSAVALDQQAIDRRGVKSMADLVRYTPGVSLQPDNGGMTAQIAIRGIKSPVGAATTGVYIDDTPVQVRAFGIATENFYPTLFDLQRVEVLRGPQGTLFGAGAQGGVVKFVTPEPSTTTSSAYARAGISTTEDGAPSYELGAAAGGPISDKVGFRVSAFYRRDGGWIDRVDPKTGASAKEDINANTVATARLALAFKPTDQLTITPSLYVERGLLSDRNYMWDNLSNLDGGKFRSGWLNEQPTRNVAVLPSLKVALEGKDVAFISNTSYFKRDLNKTSDFTTVVPAYLGIALSPVPYSSTSPLQAGQRSYTQEFRLQSNNPSDRLKWVVGAFYQYVPLRTSQYVIDPQLPQLTASQGYTMLNYWGSNLVGPYSFTSNQRAVDRQLAAFGQVDYRIIDGLTATVGARVARSRLDFVNAQTGPLSNGTTTSGVSKETPVTPKFGLSYQADPDNLFYASASKGYRIGGANRTAPATARCLANLQQFGLSGIPPQYKSDTLWSYEAGAKNNIAGGRVQLDSSLYYSEWSGIQRAVSLLGCNGSFTSNLGKAVSKGFDTSVRTRLTDDLTVSLAVAYTHARFTQSSFGSLDTTATPPVARRLVSDGDSLGVPPWNVTIGAEQRLNLMGREGYVRGDYTFTAKDKGSTPGRNPLNALAYDPSVRADEALHFFSARMGLFLDSVEVSAFVDNVFNAAPEIGRYHEALGLNQYFVTTIRPRTVGLNVSYRY